MKICVIGYSGGGKSTLAKLLGEKYGIPVLHLDATFWYGDWQRRTREEQSEIVGNFMAEHNAGWVIDGNYFKIRLDRFSECDAVYFLNYNRFFCFNEVRKRYKKNKGKVRGDCPCTEKFDFEFAKWILYKGRTRRCKKNYEDIIKNCNGKAYVFKSRKQLNKFLKLSDVKIPADI